MSAPVRTAADGARAAPRHPRGSAGTSVAERVYRLLLRAYPVDFRAAYGRDMALAFRDQRRDQRRQRQRATGQHAAYRSGAVGFWAATAWDVARSAPALRLDARRAQWRARRGRSRNDGRHDQHHGGITMANARARQAVAGLALLSGAYEVANTSAEAWAGYAGPIPGWALGMALSLLMGALLLASGALLFRRGPAAMRRSRGAALACLALVVGLQLAFPFMSIFARLLGVGIPVALLLVTRRPRGTDGRDAGAPAVA